MAMFWNGRWTATAGEKGGTAFMHVLRAASIAAVAWSCISPASSADYGPPPVKFLSDDRLLKTFLHDIGGVDVDKVGIVAIEYSQGGEEHMIAFTVNRDAVDQKEEQFKVGVLVPNPDDRGATLLTTKRAIVIYGDGQNCGDSGGTPYCKKL
jgi:hypothetical protein